MDGPISARRRRVGPRRCRTMGSPTPLTIVITNNPRTADTATINGRTVAKGRHIVRHAALRDRFGHPGNANRTSGSRHLGRSTGHQCVTGMVEMATRRRNNSNAGTMSNSAMGLGVAADHPAHDIAQTCPKVAQQSRETPRAVDNRCRIWLAQTYNKTTPLHGRVPH